MIGDSFRSRLLPAVTGALFHPLDHRRRWGLLALGDVPKRRHPRLETATTPTSEGGNAVARSTKRHSNKDVSRPPHDRSKEIVEALTDDDEVVVDGFQRLSVLGLEVMTLDGPLRVRAVGKLKGERQRDESEVTDVEQTPEEDTNSDDESEVTDVEQKR
jgi:hypothetical protein